MAPPGPLRDPITQCFRLVVIASKHLIPSADAIAAQTESCASLLRQQRLNGPLPGLDGAMGKEAFPRQQPQRPRQEPRGGGGF
eukprot:619565-Pyramimonas_sp.AAC.1